jgi:hypothetical protein
MTGLTGEAFVTLHDILQPPEYHSFERRKGHKWSLPSGALLGLLPFYLGSTMSYKHLCLVFGITPSVCSHILNNMIKLAVGRLHCHNSAKVSFPSPEKMQQFILMVNHWEPAISDVIGFMDGVSFTQECTSECVTQNAFYCGYDCDTTVNNVFAYFPDRNVFSAHLIILGVGEIVP